MFLIVGSSSTVTITTYSIFSTLMLLEILQQPLISLGIAIYIVGLFYPSLLRLQYSLTDLPTGFSEELKDITEGTKINCFTQQ